MTLTFVLIGIYNTPKDFLSDSTIKENITLSKLKTLFISLGFNSDVINNVNFMCESKNIKNCNIELTVNDNKFIQVFSTDNRTKEELKAFFENNIRHNIQQDVNEINKKIKNIFYDKDFISLIHIYKNRPELLKLFYQFISSDDIIETYYSTDIDITENLKIIHDMNLNIQPENIAQSLYKTNNHLNLALRYLLYNN
jgi:hypothetical protein